MRERMCYLNNSGSRWVIYKNGVKEKITFKTVSGKEIIRTIIFYGSFGNFATAYISYKGKRISVFPDTVLPD